MAVQRIEKEVTLHLSDAHFNVQQLCQQLSINCMQANRLLKKVYGMSPLEYIKWRRLERAAHLIQFQELSIQEVGMASGFNSAAYFSKCFKQHFGCSPSHYKIQKPEQ